MMIKTIITVLRNIMLLRLTGRHVDPSNQKILRIHPCSCSRRTQLTQIHNVHSVTFLVSKLVPEHLTLRWAKLDRAKRGYGRRWAEERRPRGPRDKRRANCILSRTDCVDDNRLVPSCVHERSPVVLHCPLLAKPPSLRPSIQSTNIVIHHRHADYEAHRFAYTLSIELAAIQFVLDVRLRYMTTATITTINNDMI